MHCLLRKNPSQMSRGGEGQVWTGENSISMEESGEVEGALLDSIQKVGL